MKVFHFVAVREGTTNYSIIYWNSKVREINQWLDMQEIHVNDARLYVAYCEMTDEQYIMFKLKFL
jgi:hypothetical protein